MPGLTGFSMEPCQPVVQHVSTGADPTSAQPSLVEVTLDLISDGGEFSLSTTADSSWQRAHELRLAARKAFIELDSKSRVQPGQGKSQDVNKLKFDEGEPRVGLEAW